MTAAWMLMWLVFAATAQAVVVTFTPVADATISEKNLNGSIGYESTLEMGTTGPSAGYADSRTLIRFNLSGIPTNAVIASAALTLQLERTAPAVTNLWASLHKLLRAWSENDSTWTKRLSSSVLWSAPGATAPADFVAGVTQSNLITTTLGPYTFVSNPRMVADVQDWVLNPGDNWGWIMISELEGVGQTETKFSSRETAMASRPKLVVDFFIPAPRPNLAMLAPTNGSFQFRLNAESNRTYTVEHCASLPATNWTPLATLGPWSAATNVVFSDPVGDTNRFYRVRTP